MSAQEDVLVKSNVTLFSRLQCIAIGKKRNIYTMINKKGIIKTKQKRLRNTHRHPIFAISANCSRKSNATLIEIRNNRNNITYSQQIETKSMLKKYIQTTSRSLEWKALQFYYFSLQDNKPLKSKPSASTKASEDIYSFFTESMCPGTRALI